MTGGTYIAKRPRSPFFRPYQPATGLLGDRPGFHGTFSGRLLLIGAAERHPVAVRFEHGVKVFETAKVVAEFGLANLDDERGRVGGFIAIGLEFGASGRSFEGPGILFCSGFHWWAYSPLQAIGLSTHRNVRLFCFRKMAAPGEQGLESGHEAFAAIGEGVRRFAGGGVSGDEPGRGEFG